MNRGVMSQTGSLTDRPGQVRVAWPGLSYLISLAWPLWYPPGPAGLSLKTGLASLGSLTGQASLDWPVRDVPLPPWGRSVYP